jgi:tetratricopeptide (TPR) repeat protein
MKTLFLSVCLLLAMLPLFAQQPDHPAYTEAETLAKANNCEEALAKYESAISAEATNSKYYLGKANCLYKLKMADEALSVLNQAVRANNAYLPAWQMMARIHEANKNYAQAVSATQAQLPHEKIPAKKLRLYSSIVRLHILQNNITEAESALSEAKALSADHVEVLYAEAEIMRAKRDYMQAIGFYERAVLNLGKMSPADAAKFYFGLGDAYNRINDTDNAIRAWQKARFGPYKKIVEAELMKTNPDFYLKMGISYFQASQYDEAMTQLRRAIEIKSDHAQAYRYMAMINDKRDLTSDAEKCYKLAVDYEMDPNKKVEIEIAYLNMLMDNELYSKALPVADNILKDKPGNLKVLLQKAQAEYATGKFSNASRTAQKALADPTLTDAGKKAPYYFVLGLSLKASGDIDGAMAAFKNAAFGVYKGAAQNEIEELQPEFY